MGVLVRAALGVLGFALLSGCSSSDASNTSGQPNAPARVANTDQVRAALKPVVDAECSWLFKCCSEGELAQQLGPATSTDCADHLFESASVGSPYGLTNDAATQNLLAVLDFVQYGFDRSSVTIDAAAVAACAAKRAADDCTPAPPVDHCAPVAPITDDPCSLDKLLVGSLKAGSDCTPYSANGCAPGLTCRTVASQLGVCVAEPVVGDLCLQDDDCGALLCDWTKGTCVTGAAYGAACAFSDPDHPVPGTESTRCGAGLVCDTIKLKCTDYRCAAGINCGTDAQCPAGVTCVSNVCGPLKAIGERCNQQKDCADGVCSYDQLNNGSYCVALKADGTQCQQATDCASGFCGYDQTLMMQICTATLKDGAMCGQGAECTSGKCFNGLCAAVAAGDVCATDFDCAPSLSLFCIDLACASAPFKNGAGCTADAQCKSEACVAMKCAPKGTAGDPCGAVTDAPCDETSYCAVPAKGAAKCAAKKAQGELCTLDIECAGGCRASRGALRCDGEPAGVASCGGT